MPIFCMLTTFTEEGRRTIKEYPDWMEEIDKEVEFMGIKILAQYALLGQYDFVNIVEAPSNEAVAKLAVELSARGKLQTLTLAAMTLEDFTATLKKTSSQPPW